MAIKVTPEQIIAIGGAKTNKKLAEELAKFITEQGDKFYLDTPLRIAHFLGQTAAESGGYTVFVENLKYSAKRLMAVWPKHFKTLEFAKKYEYNERKLANFIYGEKITSLGNRPGTDDGYDMRGQGLKQLTGRANYNAFNNWVKKNYPGAPDFLKNPEKITEYPWMILSAVWFWVDKKVYELADKDDAIAVTKRINGGTNGLSDRQVYTNKAKKIIVNVHVTPSKPVEKKPTKPDPILKEYQTKLNKIASYKKEPAFNVGKADGWHGPKTEKAISAFQKSTGELNVSGVLDSATKEAIDNVMIIVEGGKQTTVAEDLEVVTAPTPVIVEPVPVAIPAKLTETVDKPAAKSNSLWAILSTFSAFLLALWDKGVNLFTSLDPAVQIVMLVLLTAAVVFIIRSIRNSFRSKEGIEELKAKINEIKEL